MSAKKKTATKKAPVVSGGLLIPEKIAPLVHVLRHEKVILDSDLAELRPGDSTKQFNVISTAFLQISCSKSLRMSAEFQGAMSMTRGGRRTLPYVFTEQGVAMLSSVLRSPRAVEVNIAIMMDALAPGGRCAVVVPEGLLFGSTEAHVDLRKKLVIEFNLPAVISLPAGVFKPYAGVKTSVLVFSRSVGVPPTSSDRKVLFYEIKNDGYDPDKVSGGGRVETPNDNGIPGLLDAWAIYKASGFQNPPGPEANTLLDADVEEPSCWWATIDRIAESAFSLSAATFKPSLPTRTNAEDPLLLVDQLLELEATITTGLQQLRKQLA